MIPRKCPDHIFELFDREETKAQGRQLVIEWISSLNLQVGEIVLVPHPVTGETMGFEKGVPTC